MILGLAPMDGYTDCVFRHITEEIFNKYGNKKTETLHLRTEFMTTDGYCANPIGVIKHLMTIPTQTNTVAQIHGGNIDTLLKTVEDINKNYADIFTGIQLNIGCPATNIMKSGGGSELLRDKTNTLKIIKKLSKNSDLPFSIKTRIGLNEEDKKNQTEFIIATSNYCDTITIHGRTVKQVHAGDVDRDFIYDIKKLINSDTCKVIGNGGINLYEQINERIGNLDGVMIGQSAIGNPRIFTSHTPTQQEKYETIIKHLDLTIACELRFQDIANSYKGTGPISISCPSGLSFNQEDLKKHEALVQKTVVIFRKHFFQYIKGITDSRDLKVKLSQTTDYHELTNEINEFFDTKKTEEEILQPPK